MYQKIISKIESQYQLLYSRVIHMICNYHSLLLSYSGGLDSTVLLDILTTLMKHIKYCDSEKLGNFHSVFLRVVHVHHGLHDQADYWADHCYQQCNIRNIPFDVIYIHPNDINLTKNVESSIRNLRYKKLCNYLNAKEVLLTAHHMDDQVETVLLSLKRGSGPTGLSGMAKNMLFYQDCRILRPLLGFSKIQLEKYAKERSLNWIEDHTNSDTRFDRNFLRINIIPRLKKRWPGFNKVIIRTAQLCRNQENLLKQLLSNFVNKLIDLDGALFFYPLLKCDSIKRQYILRYWLSNILIMMPSYQLLERIWLEVALSKIDANPMLSLNKNHICRRFHKKLYILPTDLALPFLSTSVLIWNKSKNVMLLPNQLGSLIFYESQIPNNIFKKELYKNIDVNFQENIDTKNFENNQKILTNCFVRPPNINEISSIRFNSNIYGLLYLKNRYRGRKLKKLWQEFNIPPWLRNRIPLLFYNDTLIAAIGVFITIDGSYDAIINSGISKHENQNILWRICWLQKIEYYKFFKSVVYDSLK